MVSVRHDAGECGSLPDRLSLMGLKITPFNDYVHACECIDGLIRVCPKNGRRSIQIGALRFGWVGGMPISFEEIYSASLVMFKILGSIRTGEAIRI